jgi:hypothetical protein
VPVVTVVVETFFAFGDGDEVIITAGSTYVKEVSPSFASFDTLAEHALIITILAVEVIIAILAVKIFVIVRHSSVFFICDFLTLAKLIKNVTYPN